jgi:hypothetical protein
MSVKIKKDDDSEESNVVTKIKVGEKEYSAEDVQNLINMQAAATQKTQEAAAVISAAKKYGVDVETYLTQAEGAFDVMGTLIKSKVIDERGNVLKKEPETPPAVSPGMTPGSEDADLLKLFNIPPENTSNLQGADKIAAIVAKAIGPQLDEIKKIGDRVAAVDKTQGDMIRLQLQEKISGKYPNLKANDISQVFASAMNDKSKDLWGHAEALNAVKTAELAELRKSIGKEFGVDVEKFDANKLREQGSEGGAGALFQGKKFSFNAGKDDPDAIQPGKAASEFIERHLASES